MVGAERGLGLVLLPLPKAVKLLDLGDAVRAVLPFAGGLPLELGAFRRARQRFARREQCFDVDSIVDARFSHLELPRR
jgi:hypothetical protein